MNIYYNSILPYYMGDVVIDCDDFGRYPIKIGGFLKLNSTNLEFKL